MPFFRCATSAEQLLWRCNFCVQQQVCHMLTPYTLWQSCGEIILIVLTIDLRESFFFVNCFASFSNWQHLILECKNQLEMHYFWNFIIKHNRDGLSKHFSRICSHHYPRLLEILLPSLLRALEEELQQYLLSYAPFRKDPLKSGTCC